MSEEVITIDEEKYPGLLKEVPGAPKQLYVLGNVEVLKKPMIGVVGSRDMSEKGEEKTQFVVEGLIEQGYVIVSGLAKGIDKVAHETAMEKGGLTIAVLAHGLDMTYPSEHESLAEEIIKKGGLLISELPPGTKPTPGYFLERNRIIVGISRALVVVEADLKSGSISSANHAAEMGRTVFAIPGSRGTDLLIREGCEMLNVV